MKKLSAKTVEGVQEHATAEHRSRKATFKMAHFTPTNNKVNLFKNTKYFGDYA